MLCEGKIPAAFENKQRVRICFCYAVTSLKLETVSAVTALYFLKPFPFTGSRKVRRSPERSQANYIVIIWGSRKSKLLNLALGLIATQGRFWEIL